MLRPRLQPCRSNFLGCHLLCFAKWRGSVHALASFVGCFLGRLRRRGVVCSAALLAFAVATSRAIRRRIDLTVMRRARPSRYEASSPTPISWYSRVLPTPSSRQAWRGETASGSRSIVVTAIYSVALRSPANGCERPQANHRSPIKGMEFLIGPLALKGGENAFRLHCRPHRSGRRSALPCCNHRPLNAGDQNAKHWPALVIFISDSHVAVVSCGEALTSSSACNGVGKSPHHVTVINLGASLVWCRRASRTRLSAAWSDFQALSINLRTVRADIPRAVANSRSAASNASRLPGNVSAALSLNASAR